MRNTILHLFGISVLASMAFSGCSVKEPLVIDNTVEKVETITATLSSNITKTSYREDGGRLKTSWAEGDYISVSPYSYRQYKGLYKISGIDGNTATFTAEQYVGTNASEYCVFYPGDKIDTDISFMNFKYKGQVQKKSDPMAHLASYHTMHIELNDYNNIDFTGADQSACMKFNLSGMTFQSPKRVSLSILRDGFVTPVFYENNTLPSYYTGGSDEKYEGSKSTPELSLELDGYGTESEITAYMMMSNKDVDLKSGDVVRVGVTCTDGVYTAEYKLGKDLTLNGGYFHTMTIGSGWSKSTSSPDYKNYSYDGDVVTLQVGKGNLDLVIMGDGFIAEDFDNGTYDKIMKQAFSEFFTVEPFTYYRDQFNVYYVKAVSPERVNAVNTGANGARGTGTITKFSSTFVPNSTSISGNNSLVREYAKKAFKTDADKRIKTASVVVMVNQEAHAGTCHISYSTSLNTDYAEVSTVAYCALGTSQQGRIKVIHHEVNGHGFGILADEYYYSTSTLSTQKLYDLRDLHKIGMYKNVDCYIDDNIKSTLTDWALTTKENVYWHDMFGTSNNYESAAVESLGVYKGAYTFSFAFCRPTEDGSKSIMNEDTGFFNAISRRQIVYRIKRLTNELKENCWGAPEELNSFLEWDKNVFLPKMKSSSVDVKSKNYVEADTRLDPPVLISGSWLNGHFVEGPSPKKYQRSVILKEPDKN